MDVDKVAGRLVVGGVDVLRLSSGRTSFRRVVGLELRQIAEVRGDLTAFAAGMREQFASRVAAEAWVCDVLNIQRIDYAAMLAAEDEVNRKAREARERAARLARKVRAEFGEGEA